MFGCPKCGCQSVEEDCPKAWRVVHYDDNGEIVDCESDSGIEAFNSRCADCGLSFNNHEWISCK